MILTEKEITWQVAKGNIVLDQVTSRQINHDSVDVSLYKQVLVSTESFVNTHLDLKAKRREVVKDKESIKSIEYLGIVNKQIHHLDEIKSRVVSTIKDWYIVDITKPTIFVKGLFVLGAVDEWVGTKASTDLCCEFRLKSTPARLGLDHAFASWIETGYFSRLCLELTFNQSVELQKGSMVGQYIFHKTTDKSVDYTKGGSYQSFRDLDTAKRDWSIKDILPKSKIKTKSEIHAK